MTGQTTVKSKLADMAETSILTVVDKNQYSKSGTNSGDKSVEHVVSPTE